MRQWTRAAALCGVAATVLSSSVAFAQCAGQTPPDSSPAGPLAYSCGVPAMPLAPGARPDQAIFDQDGTFIAQWFQFGRPSGMFMDRKTDTRYVADSESRDGRTNTGRNALAPTGYGFNPGIRRGIRIGSARDGSVRALIPDPCPYPYASGSSNAEGVSVDAQGNVYGADFLMDVRKFVLTRGRQTN